MTTDEAVALATLLSSVTERAVSAYSSAKAGTVSVSSAIAHLSAMLDALPSEFAADDAAAQTLLDEKFR